MNRLVEVIPRRKTAIIAELKKLTAEGVVHREQDGQRFKLTWVDGPEDDESEVK